MQGNVSVGHDTVGHESNPSLNFGFDKSWSAQLDVILHSLARNSKRLPKIESCDDKTPTYGSGNTYSGVTAFSFIGPWRVNNLFVLHKSRWYQRTRHNPLERRTMRRTDTKIPHPVPSHLILCYNMIIYLKLRTRDYSIYLSQALFQSSTCLRSFLHCPDRDWNIYSALELKKTHFHSDQRSISGIIVCALQWPQRNWFAWSSLALHQEIGEMRIL